MLKGSYFPVQLDPCDLLLDAIDAQLNRLQVQNQKREAVSRQQGSSDAAPLSRSQSMSKDTGFDSTTQTTCTPLSALDLLQGETKDQTSEKSSGRQEDPADRKGTGREADAGARGEEGAESRREQCIWRLERLLGEACGVSGASAEAHPPSDSICTEDFAARFTQEMVGVGGRRREKGEETEAEEAEILSGAVSQVDRGQINAPVAGREVRQEDRRGINTGAAEEHGAAEKPASGPPGSNDATGVSSELEMFGRNRNPSCAPRRLAGVPMWSFDTVSIDSDLDSVCTQRVRQHIRNASGWSSVIQSVGTMDSLCSKHSDYDTPPPQAGLRSTHRTMAHGSLEEHTTRAPSYSPSLDDDDDDGEGEGEEMDEGPHHRLRGSGLCKTSEVNLPEREPERLKMEELCCSLRQKQTGVVVSVLEREEMERQLDSAKTQLFAEQRRSRDKLDSMQERLEEAIEELRQVTAAEDSLKGRCAALEEKLRWKQEQTEALEFRVSEVQGQSEESRARTVSLEKMVAQQELKLARLQEERSALQAARDGLRGALQTLEQRHSDSQSEAQVQKMEFELLKKELHLVHAQEIQKVHVDAENEKANALREQAASVTQQIQSMRDAFQRKEEEAMQLKESLEQRKELMRKWEKETSVKTMEKVHNAVEVERRGWEEKSRGELERARCETEAERRNSLALRKQAVELKTRVQELEGVCRFQRREQESALRSLEEQRQAELRRQRQRTEQESGRIPELEQSVQLAEGEADRLRAMLEEKESAHARLTSGLEQRLRLAARGVAAECRRLQLLLEQSGAKNVPLPRSPSPARVAQSLRELREQLQDVIGRLHQELDAQRRSAQQLRQNNERELRVQREELGMERDRALDSLKERLIQEHVEELSRLSRGRICEGGDEEGGVVASLRRQLRDKDEELRRVQRSMAWWKEETAARLACKFEEELTVELERKTSKAQEEKQRKLEKLEGEMRLIARERGGSGCFVSDPSPHASATSPGPPDLTSFKLLQHLQSRVKRLRDENQIQACGPSPSKQIPFNLSGSYLETVQTFS